MFNSFSRNLNFHRPPSPSLIGAILRSLNSASFNSTDFNSTVATPFMNKNFRYLANQISGGGAEGSSKDEAKETKLTVCYFSRCPDPLPKLSAGPPGQRALPDGYETVKSRTDFTATGLKHFTFYEFTVIACQSGEQTLCSHPARTMVRTLGSKPADNIPAGTLAQVPAAKAAAAAPPASLALVWTQPVEPNGAVLSYEVDLREFGYVGAARQPRCVSYQEWLSRGRRSAGPEVEELLLDGNWTTGAAAVSGSRHFGSAMGGSLLTGLADGQYRVRVRAVSLYGKGDWSEEIVARVARPGGGGRADRLTLLLAGLSLALLVAAMPLVSCLVWRHRRGRHRKATTIVTQNPDYWSYTYEPDEWEVPRDQVTYRCEDLLGTGSFGCVYRGVVRSLNTPAARHLGRSEDVSVAVKNVSEKATMRERHEFLLEAAHMKKFRQCAHVVRLIGVVSENVPTLVLMELMENGDLKTCLRNMRPEAELPHCRPLPNESRLTMWCSQIADGMYYLETKKYIHRDLAARNCMVTADYDVKIGDFGMTRDVYYTDYYKKEGQSPLPIRWMAPESLRDGVFTTASDVWSYGVVLWEICSLASQPFMSRSNEEVLHLVKSGKTLEPPVDSPAFMADLMHRCWMQKPRLRASFSAVLAFLDDRAPVPDSFRQVSWYHNREDKQQQQLLNMQLHQLGPLKRAQSNGYVEINV